MYRALLAMNIGNDYTMRLFPALLWADSVKKLQLFILTVVYSYLPICPWSNLNYMTIALLIFESRNKTTDIDGMRYSVWEAHSCNSVADTVATNLADIANCNISWLELMLRLTGTRSWRHVIDSTNQWTSLLTSWRKTLRLIEVAV